MGVWDVFDYIPAWLYYLLFIALALYLYGIWPYITNTIDIPGPKPTAFVGTLLQTIRKGLLQSSNDNLTKYGRVYMTWIGRYPSITIADPDMMREILIKDFPNYTNRKAFMALSENQKSMLSLLKDDHWKFVRGILTPAFSSGKMRGMVPIIHTCVNNFIFNFEEKCKSGQSFDLKTIMSGFTLDVIGAIGFGIDTETQKNPNDPFLEMAKRPFEIQILKTPSAFLSFIFPFLIPIFEALDWTLDDNVSTQYFQKALSETIKERKAIKSNRKDILQLLLDNNLSNLEEARDDGDVDLDVLKIDNLNRSQNLEDKEVMSQAIMFILAGYDTTASTLSFLGYNLAVNPDCQDKLIDEIDDVLKGDRPTYDNVMNLPYLEKCLCETLRLFSIAAITQRVSRDASVVKGYHIPGNTTLAFNVYAIHHDPEYWPDPERFDPERFSPEEKAKRNPYVYLPFGLGPRNCVGMRLAQLEGKMATVAILQKFRFVRSPDTEVPLKLKMGQFTQPLNGIWLKVESRQ